jgi:hypothetical protein
MADAGGALRASGARSRGVPAKSHAPDAADAPTAAASEEQQRTARIDALLAAAAGRGVDDLGELLSSRFLRSFPVLRSYVDGTPSSSARPRGARRRAARIGRSVPQLADALKAVDAVTARVDDREARRAALLAFAATCGISLNKVMANWPPERASELRVRLWCAEQLHAANNDISVQNVFARCVLFVDAEDCNESKRQDALAEAQAALLQHHADVEAIMSRMPRLLADAQVLKLSSPDIDGGELRRRLLTPPVWPWPVKTALWQKMPPWPPCEARVPRVGIAINFANLHASRIMMGTSTYTRLVDALCSPHHNDLIIPGGTWNHARFLAAPWVAWTPETHISVATRRLVDAVQVLLLALHRLRLWLPPPLLRSIIEQAISLAAPVSGLPRECATVGCIQMAPASCELDLCGSCCRSVASGPPCYRHHCRILS